jgi:predicted aspartyl protease
MLQLTEADSKLLVFQGELEGRKVSILVDSGASAQFMSESLAHELALSLTEKKIGTDVKMADGTTLPSPHIVRELYSIGTFSEMETFHLLNLASFDLVLGRPS